MSRVHDVVAIGAGPFNLGLACAGRPGRRPRRRGVPRGARRGSSWHPGMLLDEATLQVPFLADLVTMADPTSRWSFLSYLKQAGHLYPFYVREIVLPAAPRVRRLPAAGPPPDSRVRLGQPVTAVAHDGRALRGARRAPVRRVPRHAGSCSASAPGPACRAGLADLDGADEVVHTADYLGHKHDLQQRRSVTIVGSGQSAAEIYHDLLSESPDHAYALTWLTRSPRFFSMEYTKLTLELHLAGVHRLLPGRCPERTREPARCATSARSTRGSAATWSTRSPTCTTGSGSPATDRAPRW